MIKFDRKHGIVIRDEEDEFQAIMASERREARELGLSEGKERGIAIGEARGETRGIAIGEARGEIRGIAIGEARGEKRGENKKTVESIRNMKSMGFEDNIIMQALNTDEYIENTPMSFYILNGLISISKLTLELTAYILSKYFKASNTLLSKRYLIIIWKR